MRVRVLYNARSGQQKQGATNEGGARISGAFSDAGVDAELVPLAPDVDVEHVVRSAAAEGFDGIVAAGGDGTVSSVAGAAADAGIPLGVLPMGTLNHFAKDLGLPLKLEDAARVIAADHLRVIDLGEVNGRRFVNNSSIGLYPHIVSQRERQQERLGRGKWLAMLSAAVWAFRRYPTVRVTIDAGDRVLLPRDTPFVFVGNNWYQMRLLSLGGRSCLDNGELSLYVAVPTGRVGLLRLALRTLLGRLDQARDFESMCLPALTVETRKRTLKVALDGEVTRLEPPLEYRVVPRALSVFSPPPQPPAADGESTS